MANWGVDRNDKRLTEDRTIAVLAHFYNVSTARQKEPIVVNSRRLRDKSRTITKILYDEVEKHLTSSKKMIGRMVERYEVEVENMPPWRPKDT